jgi:GMP reductase
MVANMDTTGTFEIYNILKEYKIITCLHKHYNVEDYPIDLDPNYYTLTTGISDDDRNKLDSLIQRINPYFVVVDIANGYSQKFVDFCTKLRNDYPDLTIIAGNVATTDMVQELLISARVDIVKCGIGGGSVCSTRLKTGVGIPQLSVCGECSEVANGLDGHIVSDGGCKVSGDISKAFGAGAHFVMMGGMMAGHDESGGEIIEEDGIKYKMFYGMSSEYAQDKHNGGMAKYRSSEGHVKKIVYRGKISDTIDDILGGLRSTGTYMGAGRLKDFPKCCTFVKVNRQVNEVYSTKENDIK